MINPIYQGRRAIIIGTGPSLTREIAAQVKDSGELLFGVNNTYQSFDLDVHLACNVEWWEYYGADTRLLRGRMDKWTWDFPTSTKYNVKWIEGRWMDGLSSDPSYISYGHSSGFQIIGLAVHYGITDLLLVGYDLRFPAGYSNTKRTSGGDRHYFGEYPKELQHWPNCPGGVMQGLLNVYAKVDVKKHGIRIINCSPGSALTMFENMELTDALYQ